MNPCFWWVLRHEAASSKDPEAATAGGGFGAAIHAQVRPERMVESREFRRPRSGNGHLGLQSALSCWRR